MKRIIGIIDTKNMYDEILTVEYNEDTKYYILSSNIQEKKMYLNEVEMEKLFIAMDNIENYR